MHFAGSFWWPTTPSGPGPPHYWGFTITLRHTTLGRTPPDEWSARRRDLYLTTRNTHKRPKFMPPTWFEAAIPARKQSQTNTLTVRPLGSAFCSYIESNSGSLHISCAKHSFCQFPSFRDKHKLFLLCNFVTQELMDWFWPGAVPCAARLFHAIYRTASKVNI
jgi:hypothetical protein